MSWRFSPLAAALLFVAAPAFTPLATSLPEPELPDGMDAVLEVANFAMAHPMRVGDGVLMERARAYLVDKLDAMGLEVIEQRYNFGTNILGIVRGTERPHDWVVMSAHYDTVLTPQSGTGDTVFGAWDDGAGVAAVLELARAATTRSWENTMVFAFFDDEEGGLIGSHRFIQAFDGQTWDGDTVRLVANLNMDPPGLNWPCLVDGVFLPVTFYQAHSSGTGQALLRNALLDARVAVGVPDEAFQLFTGGVRVGILSGNADNWRFGRIGIPEMYVGSSTHLMLSPGGTGPSTIPTLYPLHTPADTLAAMVAFCGGDVTKLAAAFQAEIDIVWAGMTFLDGYPGPFPRP